MGASRIFGTLFVVVAICSLTLAFRPREAVLGQPLNDDAFYAFAISHNLAQGNGITIDGATLTNGFQPLYVFLCVPLFALAGQNRVLAVRLVFVFLWLMYVGTGCLVGKIVRDFVDPGNVRSTSWVRWMAATLYLSGSIVFLINFSGLETGCLLFVYALCWHYYQTGLGDSHRHWIVFGSLLGLLVLARIDAVFMVVIVAASQFVASKHSKFSERVVRFLEVSVPSFLVSSPWWFYNVFFFHSLMPSSGTAEQAWAFSPARFERMYAVLTRDAIPWAYLTESHSDWTVGVLVRSLVLLLLAIAAIAFRRDLKRVLTPMTLNNDGAKRTLEFAWWIVGSVLILAVWYGLSSWAMHFYTRYVLPLSLVTVFFAATAAFLVYQRAPRVVTAVISLVIIPVLAGTALLWRVNSSFEGNPMLREQMSLVDKYVPPNEVVAAGQSGTIGYLREKVVNLDGKVNPQALAYQSRMWEYLPLVHATWLCDWPSYIHRYLGDHPEEHGWRFIARDGAFDLYQYHGESAGTER